MQCSIKCVLGKLMPSAADSCKKRFQRSRRAWASPSVTSGPKPLRVVQKCTRSSPASNRTAAPSSLWAYRRTAST
eukprot:14796403-Alexandrium_andersonii.AAC.1